MSNAPQTRSVEPLPRLVDIRRLAALGGAILAREPLASFGRLREMIEGEEGSVDIELQFRLDEQKRRRIDGQVRASVQVCCQRCLQPMLVEIDSRFSVAAVWSDDDAEQLPRDIDPYIVGEEPQDLRELIEDELIISLPFISFHDSGPCAEAALRRSEEQAVRDREIAAETPQRENPFSVLEQLKSGK
jgi:uncharacterized protein